MSITRLAHSQSKHTKRKAEILERVVGKLMDDHNANHPNEGFGIIDAFGGPYHYDEGGVKFVGSPGIFTKLASTKLKAFKYVTYEIESDRVKVLQTELSKYGKNAQVLARDNADWHFELPTKIPYNYGVIFVDPDGDFSIPWLTALHKRFPNYSLILHFNNTSIKRQRARKIKRGHSFESLMHKLCQLPRWPKYISSPTPGWHWTLIVQTLRPIDLSFLKPILVPLSSKKGIEYLSDAALSENEVLKGVDIFNPIFKAPDLKAVLSLI